MKQHFFTLIISFLFLLSFSSGLTAQDCISGTVFEDLNNNGIQDDGEPGIVGLTVTLNWPDGSSTTSSTGVNGFYELCDLITGNYTLFISDLVDGVVSQPNIYTFGYVQGENLEPFNFAVLNLSDFGQVRGLVFYDLNRNGIHDVNEPVVEGHGLILSGNTGETTIRTDPYGVAFFENIPGGAYEIRSETASPPNTAFGNGGSVLFEILGGQSVLHLFPIQNLDNFGGIQDYVCYDIDANGQNDPLTEPGIYGHTIVSLFNEQGEEIGTTQTDPSGRYGFVGLLAGNYTVQFNFDPLYLEPTTPTNYNVDLVLNEDNNPGPFYANPIRKRFNCGMGVSTFGSAVSQSRVLSVKDIRDRSSAPAPSTGTVWSTVIDMDHPSWRNDQMGEVFGLAVDEEYNIYVSATQIPGYVQAFNISLGDPIIYKVDPYTLVATPYLYAAAATTVGTSNIASANTGLGNITYDVNSKTLYATNMTDGTIVAIGSEQHANPGQVLQVYNVTSFTAASVAAQRVWGIGYNSTEQKVYFSSPSTGGVDIYSIDAPGGVLTGPENLEFSVTTVPVADIAFTAAGTNMLIAERGSAHGSRTYQYSGNSGAWSPPMTVYVGAFGSGNNSSGGVDYAYENFDGDVPLSSNCETFIAGSGNALDYTFGNYIYGYTIFPQAGNLAPDGWPMDVVDYTNVNSVYLDNDVDVLNADKGYQGDVEVFDCDCPPEEIPDCAESHGLDILPASPVEPAGIGDCCHILDFNNVGNFDVYGISLNLLDGVQFQTGYQIAPGFYTPNFSASDMIITPNALGTMPTNINGLINFCLENIHGTPQFMVIDYLDENYEVFCTDTLRFECAPQSGCLEFVLDSLVCDTLGYKYTVDFVVPPGTDFDIGYIKFSSTQALPAGTYVEPIGLNADPANSGHTFSPPLMPGDMVSLMYMVHTVDDLSEDSLCVIITAHDDIEERLCCFAYENCLPYPYCPMPCDDVEANIVPNYQGEAAECCDGDPRDYRWLQDLIGDCAALPCGAVVSCCEYQGQRVIVIEDDVELCSDPFGVVYDCQGAVVFQFGGIGGVNFDLYQQLSGCRVIYDCYQPTVDECCFDLLITDTYTFDPSLITAVQTTIITPGVSFTGQSRLNAILNGWIPTDLVVDQDILWTHNSGATPNGIDDYLFTFCIEGTTSTDSVFVEVNWLDRDSVVCQDTVAVYCPDCLQIVDDSLSCITDSDGVQSYLYQFTFTNSSAFDVNAVYVGDVESPQDTVLNPGVQMLGTIVPPGATYTGLIPVQIDPGLDSACFDIVLRQIIGDSINISCCYATHCIELPPCDELPRIDCPDQNFVQSLNCTDHWDPVCGCDGQTYSNICYAQNAGVALWTNGACDDLSISSGTVNLGGTIVAEGAQLNWIVTDDPDNYDFFVVRRRASDESDYQTLAIIPNNGTQVYEFLDLNPGTGLNSYQVIGALASGLVAPSNQIELFVPETMGIQTTIYAFPSPATEVFNVTVNKVGHAQLQLISPDGQIQFHEQAYFNGSPHPVNASQLMDGVFIVRLRFDDGETAQQRVVKVGTE